MEARPKRQKICRDMGPFKTLDKFRPERLKYPYSEYKDPESGQAGGKYEGERCRGKRHGTGIMYYQDGNIYDGEWKNDRPEGKGSFITADKLCTYVGDFLHGEYNGKGIYSRKDNNIQRKYEGNFRDNYSDGIGIEEVVYEDGSVQRYEGQWARDAKHGKGVLITPKGGKFEGSWNEGIMGCAMFIPLQPNTIQCMVGVFGQGSDGDLLVHGDEEQPLLQGHGSMRMVNGDEYIGEFQDGEFHGLGMYKFACGDVCTGEYRHGRSNGEGSYMYAEGCFYRGSFEDDQVHTPMCDIIMQSALRLGPFAGYIAKYLSYCLTRIPRPCLSAPPSFRIGSNKSRPALSSPIKADLPLR